MTFLTTPGDLAGLVLLAAAVVVVSARFLIARNAGQADPRHAAAPAAGPQATRSGAGLVVPQQRFAPPPRAAFVPQQTTWQARPALPAAYASGLVEDRVSGTSALELEEAVGPRDQ